MNRRTKEVPWNYVQYLPSPDGKFILQYCDVHELGMDGPQIGKIDVSPLGYRPPDRYFGGPALWSQDSRYLAIPEWQFEVSDRRQVLDLLDVQELLIATSNTRFRLLCITDFAGAIVSGVDNFMREEAAVAIPIGSLSWRHLDLADRQA